MPAFGGASGQQREQCGHVGSAFLNHTPQWQACKPIAFGIGRGRCLDGNCWISPLRVPYVWTLLGSSLRTNV